MLLKLDLADGAAGRVFREEEEAVAPILRDGARVRFQPLPPPRAGVELGGAPRVPPREVRPIALVVVGDGVGLVGRGHADGEPRGRERNPAVGHSASSSGTGADGAAGAGAAAAGGAPLSSTGVSADSGTRPRSATSSSTATNTST